MATGNAELVRSSFDAFLRGDWDALAEVMDPHVEWLWSEPGDWDCHDRRTVLATLFERQRAGVVTGLNNVVAVDVFVEVTGPRLEERAAGDTSHGALSTTSDGPPRCEPSGHPGGSLVAPSAGGALPPRPCAWGERD